MLYRNASDDFPLIDFQQSPNFNVGRFLKVRPAWALTWRFKSATGFAVGTVS